VSQTQLSWYNWDSNYFFCVMFILKMKVWLSTTQNNNVFLWHFILKKKGLYSGKVISNISLFHSIIHFIYVICLLLYYRWWFSIISEYLTIQQIIEVFEYWIFVHLRMIVIQKIDNHTFILRMNIAQKK
jgi:hypothetical protein